MTSIEHVPVDIFLDIIKDLTYLETTRLGQCSKTLYSMCQNDRVKVQIQTKRPTTIQLAPRKSYQAFEVNDLRVGAIINRVMLNDFTQNYKHLLTKTHTIFEECQCGKKDCDKYRELIDQWEESLTNLEPYEKYNFIRSKGHGSHVKMVPHVITKGGLSGIYARQVEKVGGQYQYLNVNESDELLLPYQLNQSRVFGNAGKKIGFTFVNDDIAVVPNSFKR